MAVPLWGTDAAALVSDRSDGDLRPPRGDDAVAPADDDPAGPGTAPGLERLQRRLVDRRWVLARQLHGGEVIVVDGAGVAPGGAGRVGDALVTTDPSLCLAVLGADCGLIALASPDGVIGAAHAGWRGLVAGVVGAAVGAMRRAGAGEIVARLGPCIHPCCYAFGRADLEAVLRTCPDAVGATTRSGAPALDLPASLRRALERAGVAVQPSIGGCTACSPRWFSHRGGDVARQALAVFRASP